MVQQRILAFPKDFLWGTASAAHQSEGGNENNQWYEWERGGRILSGERAGRASNWWEGAEEDFERAAQMENGTLRLSVEWSRIEPWEGKWDSEVIGRYRQMLGNLHERGLRPLVTLHHFTEPLWYVRRGGFAKEENLPYFGRYVDYVVAQLGDLCDFWTTINEPNIYAIQGYLLGDFPPGEKDMLKALQVLRNLMQAHVQAYHIIHRRQPGAEVGYAMHYRLFDPAAPNSILDRLVAGIQNTMFNWASLEAGESGNFPFPARLLLKSIPLAVGSRDYHGINYYTREMVAFDLKCPLEAFGRRFVREGAVCNDEGLDASFGEIYPQGLYRVVRQVYERTRGNKPIYITENGFCDRMDDRRPKAILEHLVSIYRLIQEGIPVKGYYYWTLVDNFEWNNGWFVRFGLIELNPQTQERLPRRSASMYGEICRANAITEEIVERYAPELLESIFRPQMVKHTNI